MKSIITKMLEVISASSPAMLFAGTPIFRTLNKIS